MKKIIMTISMISISTVSLGQEISKDIWLGQMRAVMSSALCTNEQIFRQCFNVSESQCKMAVTDATNACVNQYERKIPEKLKLPEKGRYWGFQLGMCAGNAYGVILRKQLINSNDCKGLIPNLPEETN